MSPYQFCPSCAHTWGHTWACRFSKWFQTVPLTYRWQYSSKMSNNFNKGREDVLLANKEILLRKKKKLCKCFMKMEMHSLRWFVNMKIQVKVVSDFWAPLIGKDCCLCHGGQNWLFIGQNVLVLYVQGHLSVLLEELVCVCLSNCDCRFWLWYSIHIFMGMMLNSLWMYI